MTVLDANGGATLGSATTDSTNAPLKFMVPVGCPLKLIYSSGNVAGATVSTLSYTVPADSADTQARPIPVDFKVDWGTSGNTGSATPQPCASAQLSYVRVPINWKVTLVRFVPAGAGPDSSLYWEADVTTPSDLNTTVVGLQLPYMCQMDVYGRDAAGKYGTYYGWMGPLSYTLDSSDLGGKTAHAINW